MREETEPTGATTLSAEGAPLARALFFWVTLAVLATILALALGIPSPFPCDAATCAHDAAPPRR